MCLGAPVYFAFGSILLYLNDVSLNVPVILFFFFILKNGFYKHLFFIVMVI